MLVLTFEAVFGGCVLSQGDDPLGSLMKPAWVCVGAGLVGEGRTFVV